MSLFHALILSIIEGVTEFLPISSTGHLILATKLLGIASTNFTKSFDIIIQLGAIMAVVTLYANKIMKKPTLIKPILIAFLPTMILGAALYKIIKTYLLDNDLLVAAMLILGGIIFIALEWYWNKQSTQTTIQPENLSWKRLVGVGLFQAISMVPGVSRAGSTIVGGRLLGLSKEDAIEFSFLLAVPTMGAATALDLLKNAESFQQQDFALLAIGFIGAWITALIVVKTLLATMKKFSFTGFGVYRIAAGVFYWILMH